MRIFRVPNLSRRLAILTHSGNVRILYMQLKTGEYAIQFVNRMLYASNMTELTVPSLSPYYRRRCSWIRRVSPLQRAKDTDILVAAGDMNAQVLDNQRVRIVSGTRWRGRIRNLEDGDLVMQQKLCTVASTLWPITTNEHHQSPKGFEPTTSRLADKNYTVRSRTTAQQSRTDPLNPALMMSPRLVMKRLQSNCQARRTDQQSISAPELPIFHNIAEN
ncbi:hypothetical protein CLF_102037 [Clonorchis sinensis]|uniref:Uncharacterized protein n=1 Tax=Clonorchis sinensis TaxID=79923 RepID=G7Y755_CLOSI|nr:hypothetical protein CLF_102037 [Clonorchis sinensis]